MKKWLQIALLTLFISQLSGRFTIVQAQDTLSAFQLVAPSDSTIWGVSQQCQGSRLFRWQASVPTVPALVGYKVVFYTSQQASTPVWSWPSAPTILDTFASIPEDSLLFLISRLGALNRQQLTLYWGVLAENDVTKLSRNSDSLSALTLWTEADTLSSARLLLPLDNASVAVTRVAPLSLAFKWAKAFYNIPNAITSATYQLEIDTTALFSSPLAIYTTTDTTWVLNRIELDSLALLAGLSNLNQTRMLYWRVTASQCSGVKSTSVVRQWIISRIDEQTQPFSTLMPSFGQSLIIPENSLRNYSFNWTNPAAATQTVPLQVALLIDSLNGNFTQPWLSIPVPSGDTSLVVSSSVIRQNLLNSGVGLHLPASFKWAVSASYGGNRRLSGNANLIVFERKLDTISRFSNLLPADSLVLDVAASGNINSTFVWQSASQSLGDTLTYRWKFWPLNGNPQNPTWSVPSANGGLQNSLSISNAQWNTLLDSAGILVNQSIEGFWAAEAQAGGIFRLADSIRYLRIHRVLDSLSSFAILSPTSNSTVLLAQQTNHPVSVTWSKSVNLRNNPITYTLQLDTPGASGNAPIWTGSVLNDTTYNFSNVQLNALLQTLGTTVGNSRSLVFSLKAQSIGQEKPANAMVQVTFQRVLDSIGSFAPVTPAQASTIQVGSSLTPVVFRWLKPRSFPDSLRYTLMFDIPTGNFSAPIFEKLVGTDTVFSFPSRQLDSLLAGLGVFQGQTYNLRWAIRAQIGTQTRRSSIFSLNLTRFADTLSRFSLLAPADSVLVIATGTSSVPIDLRWNSSRSSNLTPVTYQCYWDFPAANFSTPFFTKSAGADTTISLTTTELRSALAPLGAIPDTGTYLWTIVAEAGPLALQARVSRLVRIVWNVTTSVEEISANVRIYPNPVTDKVMIEVGNRGLWNYTITDMAGKSWKKGVVNFDGGIAELPFFEAHPGLYFLQLCQDEGCRTFKILKQ